MEKNYEEKIAQEIEQLKAERERVVRDAQVVYQTLSQVIERLEILIYGTPQPPSDKSE